MCFPSTSGYSFFHIFSFTLFFRLQVSFIHFPFSSSFFFSILTLRPDPKSTLPLLKFAPAGTAAAQFIASGDCTLFKIMSFNEKYHSFVALCVSGLQNWHHGSLQIFILGMSWQLSKSNIRHFHLQIFQTSDISNLRHFQLQTFPTSDISNFRHYQLQTFTTTDIYNIRHLKHKTYKK